MCMQRLAARGWVLPHAGSVAYSLPNPDGCNRAVRYQLPLSAARVCVHCVAPLPMLCKAKATRVGAAAVRTAGADGAASTRGWCDDT